MMAEVIGFRPADVDCDAVVKVLERHLAEAKAGRLAAVAVAAVGRDSDMLMKSRSE